MKNLNELDVQEMNAKEMKNVDGGVNITWEIIKIIIAGLRSN